MSKMIQIRDVPDDVHRKLKARAAQAGMSLSDYIKRDLAQSAARPTIEEIEARILERAPSGVDLDVTLEALRERRER